MSVWGALAGGFVGTLVLTTVLRAANELDLTRIDLPFLLGTAFTGGPDACQGARLRPALRASGSLFALVYYAGLPRDRPERLVARALPSGWPTASSPARPSSTSCCRSSTRAWAQP